MTDELKECRERREGFEKWATEQGLSCSVREMVISGETFYESELTNIAWGAYMLGASRTKPEGVDIEIGAKAIFDREREQSIEATYDVDLLTFEASKISQDVDEHHPYEESMLNAEACLGAYGITAKE